MSSSNRDRYAGRGGRGFRSRSRSQGRRSYGDSRSGRGNKSSTTKPVEKEMKFAPQAHGSTTNATYATVKDHVVTQIQKTFKSGHDVAKSLRDMKQVNLYIYEPKRRVSELEKRSCFLAKSVTIA